MSIRHVDLDPHTLSRIGFLRGERGRRALSTYERVDSTLISFLRRHADTALRGALGIVFVWFGALKVIDRSPVAELVADTTLFLPEGFIVPALGVIEVAIGLGLLLGVGLRIVLLLFILQMAGTFVVFITQPGEAFSDGNPLLLTTLGEFVVKNLVLMAAGLVIGSHVAMAREQALGAKTL
jgi:putative oxidoreductase